MALTQYILPVDPLVVGPDILEAPSTTVTLAPELDPFLQTESSFG
jgi:hypothetical protein